MKNVVIGVLIFAGGVGAGVLATNGYFRNKYAKISAEEIAEIRQVYVKKNKELQGLEEAKKISDEMKTSIDSFKMKPPVPTLNEHPRKPELDELAVKYGYKQAGDLEGGGEDDDVIPKPLTRLERRRDADDMPYVISPDEFGEVGYEQIELTYYDDGVLADDDDEIIDDPDAVVGPYALTSFGKYEDDAVFVRNDARRCDYEILADHRNYDDVVRPRRVEV